MVVDRLGEWTLLRNEADFSEYDAKECVSDKTKPSQYPCAVKVCTVCRYGDTETEYEYLTVTMLRSLIRALVLNGPREHVPVPEYKQEYG